MVRRGDVVFFEGFGRKRAPIPDTLKANDIGAEATPDIDDVCHLAVIFLLHDGIEPKKSNFALGSELCNEGQVLHQTIE